MVSELTEVTLTLSTVEMTQVLGTVSSPQHIFDAAGFLANSAPRAKYI
jgi:hypothetical protein